MYVIACVSPAPTSPYIESIGRVPNSFLFLVRESFGTFGSLALGDLRGLGERVCLAAAIVAWPLTFDIVVF